MKTCQAPKLTSEAALGCFYFSSDLDTVRLRTLPSVFRRFFAPTPYTESAVLRPTVSFRVSVLPELLHQHSFCTTIVNPSVSILHVVLETDNHGKLS